MADELEKFLIMRAFRIGHASAKDIVAATDVSASTATRAVRSAEQEYSTYVHRVKRNLVPRPLAKPPIFATESALFDQLDHGRRSALETGLFERELPISYVTWTNSCPAKEGVFDLIVKSIIQHSALEIVYVGMARGNEPALKLVYPLGLEKMNDQWRLVAQDLQKQGAPIRVYVLSRIMDASVPFRNKIVRKNVVLQNHADYLSEFKVELNPLFSEYQKSVMARELRIHDGKIKVASRSRFEFLRRFSDEPVTENGIWPPIKILS